MQKAVIVRYYPYYVHDDDEREQHASLDHLNKLLKQGWKVVSCTPMGGDGQEGYFASIVVLEK